MTRSAEFGATVKGGVRVTQPDLVLHAHCVDSDDDGPRIGFVVSKAVGNAVERHRVARRLRHASRGLIAEMDTRDRWVVRALPSSRGVGTGALEKQLCTGARRVRSLRERRR